MTNNFKALRPKLMERFRYERGTGFFYHKRTAAPHHWEGQRAEKREGHALVLRHDGLKLAAKRVAWLFVTEEWPVGHLTAKNGDPDDNRFENLVGVREASQEKRKRICQVCGNWFVVAGNNVGKYCSRTCADVPTNTPLPAEVPCRRCGQVLPIGEYPIYGGHVRTLCRPCIREHDRNRRLATKYGMSVAEFEALLAKQNYVCAICGEAPPDSHPNVDHDHKTGAVRGILCSGCNTGLGHFRDSPDRLRAAAAYLET